MAKKRKKSRSERRRGNAIDGSAPTQKPPAGNSTHGSRTDSKRRQISRQGPRGAAPGLGRKRAAWAIFVLVVVTVGSFWLAGPHLLAPAPGESPDDRELPSRPQLDEISWLSGSAANVREARKLLSAGNGAFHRGDFARADAAMARAFVLLGNSKELPEELSSYHLLTVQAAVEKGDLPGAERRAVRWLESHPDDAWHLFFLGRIRYLQQHWAGAREALKRAGALLPQSIEVHRWLGEVCFQMGAKDDGLAAVERCLQLLDFDGGTYRKHPLAEKTLRNGYRILHRFRDYERLAKVAHAYRQHFAKSPELRRETAREEGVALAHLGRYEEALPLLTDVIEGTPATEAGEEIRHVYALALSKLRRWKEAANAYAALLADKPSFAKGYYQLGICLARLGRPKDAEILFAESRRLAPAEREERRELEFRGSGQIGKAAVAKARGLEMVGEFAAAEAALRQGDLRSDPFAVFALARFYTEQLRLAEAERVLAHASQIVGTESVDLALSRAALKATRGLLPDAIRTLEELHKNRRLPAQGQMELARLWLRAERADAVVTLLTALRQREPNAEADYLLGRAHLAVGRGDLALKALRRVSRGDLRWRQWQGDAWLAQALLAANPNAAAIDEARELLQSPGAADSTISEPLLAARLTLTQFDGEGQTSKTRAAREALAAFRSGQSYIDERRSQIARTPWPQSAPLYGDLARAHAARGEIEDAIRWALVLLSRSPNDKQALRETAGWLAKKGYVFYQLNAERRYVEATPDDVAARTSLKALEERWLIH